MTATIVTIALTLSLNDTGGWLDWAHRRQNQHQHYHQHHQHNGHRSGGYVFPPGPGDGWGFPNGNPDGYGWFDHGEMLPLGGDRTPEYFFPRYLAVPPEQAFLGTYYNPYVMRGQRYIPYVGGGGEHPMGGPPPDTALTPERPYSSMTNTSPVVPVPRLNGRIEAPPINSGTSGLTP